MILGGLGLGFVGFGVVFALGFGVLLCVQWLGLLWFRGLVLGCGFVGFRGLGLFSGMFLV